MVNEYSKTPNKRLDNNQRRAAAVFHFIKRCKQRGLNIMDQKMAMRLNVMALGNNETYLTKITTLINGTVVYEVKFEDKKFYLYYKPSISSFVTVLTEEMFLENMNNGEDDETL